MYSLRNKQKEFDKLLLKTIDETLSKTLGEASKKSFLQDIMRSSSLTWNEIPQRIQLFADVLHDLDSSNIIEDLILETFYSKLGLEFKSKKGYTFSDYIEELRKKSSALVR